MVFKLTPRAHGAWEETVLHTFTGGSDGAMPSRRREFWTPPAICMAPRGMAVTRDLPIVTPLDSSPDAAWSIS